MICATGWFGSACRGLDTEGKKPDVILLIDALRTAGQLDQVGGFGAVCIIPDAAPSPSAIESYVPLVRDRWLMRRTIQACQQTVMELMDADGTKPVDTLLANAELRVQKATEIRVKESEKTMREVVADVSENVLEKFRRGCKYQIGPALGFNYLDNIMPGLVAGQLIVLAARPHGQERADDANRQEPGAQPKTGGGSVFAGDERAQPGACGRFSSAPGGPDKISERVSRRRGFDQHHARGGRAEQGADYH